LKLKQKFKALVLENEKLKQDHATTMKRCHV